MDLFTDNDNDTFYIELCLTGQIRVNYTRMTYQCCPYNYDELKVCEYYELKNISVISVIKLLYKKNNTMLYYILYDHYVS